MFEEIYNQKVQNQTLIQHVYIASHETFPTPSSGP